MAQASRFPIKFESAYGLLFRSLFISPGNCFVEVDDDSVSVRMAWAFSAKFARSAVRGTSVSGKRVPLTRGVHGWSGRWLVNGAGDGIVAIDLDPRQRGYVMGFPVRLRELLVSVGDPSALVTALTA